MNSWKCRIGLHRWWHRHYESAVWLNGGLKWSEVKDKVCDRCGKVKLR